MEKVTIVGCGAYMDNGYGCPGEWRCLKAAALGEGKFEKPSQVISFVRCECPGRPLVPNIGMAMKLSEMKPDVIYLSSCLANANPGCPYTSAEEMAKILESKTGIKVVVGTHEYHQGRTAQETCPRVIFQLEALRICDKLEKNICWEYVGEPNSAEAVGEGIEGYGK